MKTIKKVNRGNTVVPMWAIAIGSGMSIAITILASIISAFAISNEVLPQERIGAISALTQIISAFIGCLVATILSGKSPAIVSAITCGVYAIFLVCVNILFVDGQMGRVGTGVLYILLGGALAVAIKLFGKGRTKIKKTRLH